jgi:hypothetical protein
VYPSGAAVIARRHLDHREALSDSHPADPVAHVGSLDGVLATPLGECGAALETLTALRKLQHRLLVIELLGTVDVGARVLKEALELLAQGVLVHAIPFCRGAKAALRCYRRTQRRVCQAFTTEQLHFGQAKDPVKKGRPP